MLQQYILYFNTPGRATLDITEEITALLTKTNITTGLCHIFLHHTSASLIFCENADSTVQKDLENFMAKWIPDGNKYYQHSNEGPDDMPAHLRTILTHSEITIPITKGKLALGTWQGIFLWEHRTAAFRRKLTVTFFGE